MKICWFFEVFFIKKPYILILSGVNLAASSSVNGSEILTATSTLLPEWSNIQNRPLGLDDGDDWLDESEVESYITNDALSLAAGTTIDGEGIVTPSTDNDTLQALSCLDGEIASYNGTAGGWECKSLSTLFDLDQDGVMAWNDCDDGDPLLPATDGDCDGTLTADDCDDNDATVQDINGQSSSCASFSCKDIKDQGNSTGDGVYWIDPTGGSPFQAYCNMTTDSGGWTMCYTENSNMVHIATETAYTGVYGQEGYRSDCTNIPFTEVLYVEHGSGQEAYFSSQSGTEQSSFHHPQEIVDTLNAAGNIHARIYHTSEAFQVNHR